MHDDEKTWRRKNEKKQVLVELEKRNTALRYSCINLFLYVTRPMRKIRKGKREREEGGATEVKVMSVVLSVKVVSQMARV